MRAMKAGFTAMLLSVAACGDDGMPGACTASFATVAVTVVDGAEPAGAGCLGDGHAGAHRTDARAHHA